MAHLLLARSAQSLPLAQPESRLYLLAAVPAEPLLGAFPGMAGWASAAGGNPMVAGPSFTTSLGLHPLTHLLCSQSPSPLLCLFHTRLSTHFPLLVFLLWACQALVVPLTQGWFPACVFLSSSPHLSIRPFPPLHLHLSISPNISHSPGSHSSVKANKTFFPFYLLVKLLHAFARTLLHSPTSPTSVERIFSLPAISLSAHSSTGLSSLGHCLHSCTTKWVLFSSQPRWHTYPAFLFLWGFPSAQPFHCSFFILSLTTSQLSRALSLLFLPHWFITPQLLPWASLPLSDPHPWLPFPLANLIIWVTCSAY